MPDKKFNATDKRRQIQGRQCAENRPADTADHTGQQPVPEENGTDQAVFRTKGTQNGDIPAFVFHGNNQGGNDIEARHTNHQNHGKIHNTAH